MSGLRNRTHLAGAAAVVSSIALAAWLNQDPRSCAQERFPPPPESAQAPPAGLGADPDVEVLTRGPIHEAYAMPVTGAPTAGLRVPKRPPNPVEEQPPEVKPQGDAASWIPGYWSWDDDRRDFIWVSGVWRVAPPAHRWVPGYWREDQGGWQWVSGYWMPAAKTEVVYLPQPPATLEQGPTSPTPGPTYFWVPGHWQWGEGRYVWVPGYWLQSRPNLVWVYPTYYWCPRGWVYCDGYWDYPLEQRGLLFAPVYFARPVPYYRPAVCVDVGVVTGSLFCRPAYGHYYFGDYYADSYVAIGIHPWFTFNGPRYGYDPLFCYYRIYYRHDPRWEANLRGWHEYYRGHPEMRPPHTLADQQRLLADPRAQNRPDFRNLAVGHPAGQLRDNPSAPIRVQTVAASQRAATQQSARQLSSFQSERLELEAKGGPNGAGRPAGAGPAGPERVSLTKLPSLQAAGAKTTGPASAPRTATRGDPRPKGAYRGQGRQGERPSQGDSRSDRPRAER